MADPAFVELKITHFTVKPSRDPMKPITIGFEYHGRGKDNYQEGFEVDLSVAEAKRCADLIMRGIERWAF